MVANNDKATEISAHEFNETINNSKPIVIVDFFAEWCMPCLMMSPIIEELAGRFKDIKFAKINVDENHEIAAKFGISSIPCMIVFQEGKEIDRIIGALPPEILEEKIKSYFK